MKRELLLRLLAVLQLITLSQNSHVQEAKRHIRQELNGLAEIGGGGGGWGGSSSRPHTHHHHHHHRPPPRQYRLHGHPHHNRWSGRRRSVERHQHFTGWTAWSPCGAHGGSGGHECVKRRERYCRLKRKCGFTKHVEERQCWSGCHHDSPAWHSSAAVTLHEPAALPPSLMHHHTSSNAPQAIIINAAGGAQHLPPAVATTAPPPVITTSTTHAPTTTATIVLRPITAHPTSPTYGLPPLNDPEGGLVYDDRQGGGDYNDNDADFDGEEEEDQEGEEEEEPPYEDLHYRDDVTDDGWREPNNAFPSSPEDVLDRLHSGERDFFVVRDHRKRRKRLLPPPTPPPEEENEEEEEDHFAEAPDQAHSPDYSAEEGLEERPADRPESRTERSAERDVPQLKQGRLSERRLREERQRQRRRDQRRRTAERRRRMETKWNGIWRRNDEGFDDQEVLTRTRAAKTSRRGRERRLRLRDLNADAVEGDVFQYEDFDFGREYVGRPSAVERRADSRGDVTDSSYEDVDYPAASEVEAVPARNATSSVAQAPPSPLSPPQKDGPLSPRQRRLYSKWSRWTKCSPKCTTRRYKKCRIREQCGREVLREIAYCYTEGSFCQQWLQAQVQKSPSFELRPAVSGLNHQGSILGPGLTALPARRRDLSDGGPPQSNAIVSDFIMSGKGYRGPEYSPQKLKCGIPEMRSGAGGGGVGGRRHLSNMLKIIGGKAARRGEWPWQVAIFNRFKEAFCGGTLVAPQWVITAAHCVRKVLYVRIGEHNLDYEDGTEMQLRVLRSFKHPNFDKKTVDSDVALLKLPRPVNASSWVGFSCLPHPYQPLPKNVDCTVIGWGKRRNRDVAGTSVLHQAEVPIIPMDNCRSVYHDYTITKNMFCAGHRRGRIDTCAGDSGGPLLCRDTTKPNHPWTIFGITSFGDGCAKRNKFGIYAKVPNYVDWVWSVINCNGNCKQRGYMGQ